MSDSANIQQRKHAVLLGFLPYLGVGLSAVIFVVGLMLNVQQVSTYVLPVYAWFGIAAALYVVATGAIVIRLLKERQALAMELHVIKAARSSVRIVFERKEPMWEPEERRYRVRVQNSGSAKAENVMVKLERIEPDNPLQVNVLPSALGRKDGGTDRCVINPGADDYFDLIQAIPLIEGTQIVSTRGPRSLALYTVSHMGQHFELDPSIEYRFVVSASAADGSRDERTLLVRHPPGDEIHVELAPYRQSG